MRKEQEALLHILSHTVRGGKYEVPELNSGEWQALLKSAEEHEILPLVYDSLCGSKALQTIPGEVRKKWQEKAVSASVRQIIQTNEFLTMLVHAQKKGLDPVVLKGIVCRNLYPMPCLRPSVDEDLLIRPEETEQFHAFLLSEGLMADKAEYTAGEREAAAELSYHRKDSPSYIELHKYPFDPGSNIFEHFNTVLGDIMSRSVRVRIEDVSVRTPAPTDHLLYLILHAYKHFLYSGVGIRPILDIGLFAEAYDSDIRWEDVRTKLISVNAFYYARGLIRIIGQYLLPGAAFLTSIKGWKIYEVDAGALLEDCLASGVSGASSLSRLHSSNMTLHAVEKRDRRYGKGFFGQVMRMLFPPYAYLKDEYPYLKKMPFFLPAAWVQRVIKYLLEIRKIRKTRPEAEGAASESLRIGAERVKLLRKYKIIT